MISAGSTELTNKWKNVLHNSSETYVIPESDINVVSGYNCIATNGYTVSSLNAESVSSPSSLATSPNGITRNKKVATFEWNYWVLDGSFDVLDTNQTFNGYLSSGMSGEDCTFTTNPFVFLDHTTFNLQKNQTLKFNPLCNEVPAKIEIFSAYSTTSNSYEFNIEEMLETEDIENQQYVHLYSDDIDTSFDASRVGIVFQKTLLPYRRAKLSEYNNGYKFFCDKYDMQSFTHTRNVNLRMEELPQNDVSLVFADLEGIFDGRNLSAPFHINFDKTHRFWVYYGYNFDDIGWHYVQVDYLCFRNKEIDRNSLETTINLQSTIQLNTKKYNTNNLELDPVQDPQPVPYHWRTFSGFCYAITQQLGINSITYSSNITDYFTTAYSKWQFMLAESCHFDKAFARTKMNELLQQISAIMRCALLRKENGNLHLRTLDNPSTTEVDYIPTDNVISFPSYEKEADIKTYYIQSPPSSSAPDDDKTTPVYAGSQQIATAPPLRKRIDIDGGGGEQTLEQNIVPIAWSGYDSWTWSTNMWTAWAENYRKWLTPTRYEFEEVLINPLWQVTDTLKIYAGDIKRYLGLIEKIEIQYDGGFKGAITLCSLEE